MTYYTIRAADPNGHLFKVSILIEQPNQPMQTLRLPNWIPGSYLIRDFSKHIIDIQVKTVNESLPQTIAVHSVDKSHWQFKASQAVEVSYLVYAWDLSVRGAHFDHSHAFFNGTSVFLEVVNPQEKTCQVELLSSDCSQDWNVATGMPKVKTDTQGFGSYQAPNYKSLIEYPFEMGTFTEVTFEAFGIPHRVVLTGIFNLDKQRLADDLKKICETELRLFGAPYPIDQYLFQVMVTGNDYGGLEHLNSTALMCSRNDLPYPGMNEATPEYLQFLELCSHEYFHTWNVKRIQPEVYQQADLQNPVYTNQLWWFEGITSYYDGLFLLRAGIVTRETFLQRFAEQITRVTRMPGRFKQSVAESSWLTWTKFYQQDENAPNAIVSYYNKGSLLAFGLDLTIRQQTQNQTSLDDVLLYLWQHFGRTGKGLQEKQIEQLCSQVSGVDLSDFFARYLYATEDIPFTELLADFEVNFHLRPPTSLEDKGARQSKQPEVCLVWGVNLHDSVQHSIKISHVWKDSPAYLAGLAAGDEIIAINHLKIATKAALEKLLQRYKVGAKLTVHYFRRDELRQSTLTLSMPPADRVVLSLKEDSTPYQWLP